MRFLLLSGSKNYPALIPAAAVETKCRPAVRFLASIVLPVFQRQEMTENDRKRDFPDPRAVQGGRPEEMKQKYRRMILQAHPDTDLSAEERRIRDAQETNLAYGVLKKYFEGQRKSESGRGREKKSSAGSERTEIWNAEINENAYREREILHEVEDSEGRVMGQICIARGKYLWSVEESFSLFLLSIYRCAGEILEEIDFGKLSPSRSRPAEMKVRAELAYLLAQQFTDSTGLLHEFALEETEDRKKRKIYRIAAMVELSETWICGFVWNRRPAACPKI